MCQDCEHPFIQWSIARLDERESDSDEQEEPCQCSSDWRRRNGQLIPDAVGRGGESHEGGNLPGGQTEKQGVLDIQMIGNLVRACHSSMSSGAERRVHGGHDLRGKEHRDQTGDTADHSSLAEFVAALAADHMCNSNWSALATNPNAARPGAIARARLVKSSISRMKGAASIG